MQSTPDPPRRTGAADRSRAEEFARAIAGGEGRRLEFKSGLPRDPKIARTLGAFANTSGGLLLVGIRDRGEVCGVSDPEGVRERLMEVARRELDPPPAIELETLVLDGQRVVACFVPLSPDRPHRQVADGRVLVRVGASNREAVGATLRALENPVPGRRPRGELERRALLWVEERARRSNRDGGSSDPSGDATPEGFASAMNIGKQRARRLFIGLERDGLLVAHGLGRKRWYRRP